MGDKIFERLGIYDILGVLLSGICMMGATLFLANATGVDCVVQSGLYDNMWSFLIASYLLGLIFQELTHFIQEFISKLEELIEKSNDLEGKSKAIFGNNILLRKSVRTYHNHSMFLEKEECLELEKSYDKLFNQNSVNDKDGSVKSNEQMNWNRMYNYCRSYMSKNSNNSRIDRDQALAAMARSISLFLLLALYFPIFGLCQSADTVFCVFAICVLSCLSVLFYYRFRRFCERRYITVFRFYLYHRKIVLQDKEDVKK